MDEGTDDGMDDRMDGWKKLHDVLVLCNYFCTLNHKHEKLNKILFKCASSQLLPCWWSMSSSHFSVLALLGSLYNPYEDLQFKISFTLFIDCTSFQIVIFPGHNIVQGEDSLSFSQTLLSLSPLNKFGSPDLKLSKTRWCIAKAVDISLIQNLLEGHGLCQLPFSTSTSI